MRSPAVTVLAEQMWQRLEPMLVAYGDKVTEGAHPLVKDVGHSANEVFPLRAYLSLMKSPQGDELAVSVDMHGDDSVLTIESDISRGDGSLLAEGPSVAFSLSKSSDELKKVLSQWFQDFDRFLRKSGDEVAAAAALLE